MSDQPTTEEEWLPEAVIDIPFAAVDALLPSFFRYSMEKVSYQRQRSANTGFAHYTVGMGNIGELGTFILRATIDNMTYIAITAKPETKGAYDTLVSLLWRFLSGLRLNEQRMRDLHQHTLAQLNDIPIPESLTPIASTRRPEQPTEPRRKRQRWPEDDWAWEQVNTLGREKREVRAEWNQRLSPDRLPIGDADRSFRYAIDPKREGNKRNSET